MKRKAESSFKIGDNVVVKAGVKDPDLGTDIGGWQGRVLSVEGKSVLIEWDSLTLKAMPGTMIDYCEEEGLDWSQMGLRARELDAAQPRDTVTAVARSKQKIANDHAWAFLGEEGRRIQIVLAGIDPDDYWKAFMAWRKHLNAAITFPFDAVVAEPGGPFRSREKVLVTRLNGTIDDRYGVIADLGGRHAGHSFPLCDLEVKSKLPDRQLVNDYAVWFANR